jgi:hypothetical protein
LTTRPRSTSRHGMMRFVSMGARRQRQPVRGVEEKPATSQEIDPMYGVCAARSTACRTRPSHRRIRMGEGSGQVVRFRASGSAAWRTGLVEHRCAELLIFQWLSSIGTYGLFLQTEKGENSRAEKRWRHGIQPGLANRLDPVPVWEGWMEEVELSVEKDWDSLPVFSKFPRLQWTCQRARPNRSQRRYCRKLLSNINLRRAKKRRQHRSGCEVLEQRPQMIAFATVPCRILPIMS